MDGSAYPAAAITQMLSDRDPIFLIRLGGLEDRWRLRLVERLAQAPGWETGEDRLLVAFSPSPPGDHAETSHVGFGRACLVGKTAASPLEDRLVRLERAAQAMLAEWSLPAGLQASGLDGWSEAEQTAQAFNLCQGATCGLAFRFDPTQLQVDLVVKDGGPERRRPLARAALAAPVNQQEVERGLAAGFSWEFGREVILRERPGPWLVARAPLEETAPVEGMVNTLRLHTVCQEAGCPNLGDCWARGTATFLLLGAICTRHCRFCNVAPGRPEPPDLHEPQRVAEAAVRLGLQHVVLTSVTRDDLPDGGAGHFAAAIQAIRDRLPQTTVEVLVPDFGGALAALDRVIAVRPDVFNHNIETVERLSRQVRAKAEYHRSLGVLAYAHQHGLVVKSGLMLGMGERCGEVVDAMRDLRRAGCQILTLGQYLQPTDHQLPVTEYIHPELFDWYAEVGHTLGFRRVIAGPLVRSSYHAEEVLVASDVHRYG